MLTKLLPLKLRVTLSQVPPSQKEMQGLRAHCISMRVLMQTLSHLLLFVSKVMLCIGLTYQLSSDVDNVLKGL